MLDQVLAFSIRRRWTVLAATLVLIFTGVQAFLALPIDAVPDITNVQVQVLTSAPSLGPLDVERLVTAPVERAVAGLPRTREIRSLSRYGVSAVTVVFHDDVAPEMARLMLNERLAQARASVPAALGTPELGPMSSGLGEIYQFEVRGEGKRVEVANRWHKFHAVGNVDVVCGNCSAGSRVRRKDDRHFENFSGAMQRGECCRKP
jgi:cobalt-zinc-cadmium resistance protein CzcA